MKKRVFVLFSILLINLTSFASAQFYNLGSFLRFNMYNLVLMTLFLIFFTLIYFILMRTIFGKNRAIASVLSFGISILIVAGINYYGLNLERIFYSFGFNESLLLIVSVIAIVIAGFFASRSKNEFGEKKFRFHKLFLIVGGFLFIIAAFTQAFYEKGLMIIIGLILIFIGIILWWRKRKNKKKGGKKFYDGGDSPGSTKHSNPINPNPSVNKRKIRKEYNHLKNEFRTIMKNNKGKIPARGTRDGERRHQILEEMKRIESIAKKHGFRV